MSRLGALGGGGKAGGTGPRSRRRTCASFLSQACFASRSPGVSGGVLGAATESRCVSGTVSDAGCQWNLLSGGVLGTGTGNGTHGTVLGAGSGTHFVEGSFHEYPAQVGERQPGVGLGIISAPESDLAPSGQDQKTLRS